MVVHVPMSIARLASPYRSGVKITLLLYTTACISLGWWIGLLLLLLIVPRYRTNAIECERRVHVRQHTIELVGCKTELYSGVRRSISSPRPHRRLLPPL